MFDYYPKPWRYEAFNDGWEPTVVDANGGTVAKIFWAAHPAEETEKADEQTAELGRAIAALGLPVECKCNYINQFDHNEDCPNFNHEREFNLLSSKIGILQELATEEFKINIGFNGQVYYIGLKHPTQDEEFTGDTLSAALEELRGWFLECQAMS